MLSIKILLDIYTHINYRHYVISFFFSEPYGYGMHIPLKTSLYVINNDTCSAAYESLTYDLGDLRMVIDDNVMCAGMPDALNSKPDVENSYNDACNVRRFFFSRYVIVFVWNIIFARNAVTNDLFLFEGRFRVPAGVPYWAQ